MNAYEIQVEKIQKPVDGVIEWTKIIGDGAFEDIIDGWITANHETYMKYVDQNHVVVQAGGYCGIYPRLFSQLFHIVYTFEPDPLNFYCLTQNCQIDNIIKTQGALGMVNELVTVMRNIPTNKGMHTVQPQSSSCIPTYRIDDLNLSDCNLICLDTEGYEFKALIGARATIEKYHPTIIVEDTHEGIDKLLEPYGYSRKETTYRDTIYG